MTGRPRLDLSRRSATPAPEPVAPADDPAAPATLDDAPLTWTRPSAPQTATRLAPSIADEKQRTAGQYRRSAASKKNRTVSVPADLAGVIRVRAANDRWSVTDLVFLAVEQHRDRLRAAPELPGRDLGPKTPAVARAHLVLYLADEEWEAWKASAAEGGLRTPSRLVTDALAAFIGRGALAP
jgi:hypothetical protein